MALPVPAKRTMVMKAKAKKRVVRATVQVMKKKGTSSKIAKGRFAKVLVMRGTKAKTSGGLKQSDLMKNKRGKVVSKRASAHGKRAFKRVEAWVDAVMEARQALHSRGFVAINGKTLHGKALYVKAKTIHSEKR